MRRAIQPDGNKSVERAIEFENSQRGHQFFLRRVHRLREKIKRTERKTNELGTFKAKGSDTENPQRFNKEEGKSAPDEVAGH